MIKTYAKILLTIFILMVLVETQRCDTSHYQFRGKYNLGKQDELNKTFIKVQQTIGLLGNVTKNISEYITYTIFNANTTFYYRDSGQKAQVLGKSVIAITGGKVQAQITFDWAKQTPMGTKTGSGKAIGISDVITFSKLVVIGNDTFYSFQLFDCGDVTWASRNPFKITRIDPPGTQDFDKEVLLDMFNYPAGSKTVGLQLQSKVMKNYCSYLNQSLHDEHQPIDNEFDYTWVPSWSGKRNETIHFYRRPTQLDVQQNGISLSFEVYIDKFSQWKCGDRRVPHLPYNPKQFGDNQQMISYDFYQNVLRYAIYNKMLDTDLTSDAWRSRMFQFFVGDLYQIFPKLRNKYYASEQVTGNCRASSQELKIKKIGLDTFNLNIKYSCELNVKRQKIIGFNIILMAQIQAFARQSTLDFKFKNHKQQIKYIQYGEYVMESAQLANLMISHSLNRLYEGYLFGSGWPLSPPKDYPHIMTEYNYTVIYDSTHIGPANSNKKQKMTTNSIENQILLE